jgi:hypothetical protein
MYVLRNNKVRLRKYCGLGKTIRITYFSVCGFVRAYVGGGGCLGMWASACACMLVACLIKHAMFMRVFYLWPLWLYHTFRRYLINGKFSETKLLSIKRVF